MWYLSKTADLTFNLRKFVLPMFPFYGQGLTIVVWFALALLGLIVRKWTEVINANK